MLDPSNMPTNAQLNAELDPEVDRRANAGMSFHHNSTCNRNHDYDKKCEEMFPDIVPFTIEEILILHDELMLEAYYGFNMRDVMMRYNNDKFMHELRAFVDRCNSERRK